MNIFAVVVTYNRLSLLKKTLSSLKSQTLTINTILVVNNGSTDGTKEWLNSQTEIYVINQENLGGSGGFWRGIKEAYELGADYIWCMDDDVYPYDNCLSNLISAMPAEGGIAAPQRYYNGKELVFGGECKHFNFTNPFKKLKSDIKSDDLIKTSNLISVESISFEGPLFSREVVEKIGFPEKGLFIFWDDTEYSYRAFKFGFKVFYATKARLYKVDLRSDEHGRQKRSWKYPYMIRNEVYFVVKYGGLFYRLIYVFLLFFKYLIGIVINVIRHSGKYSINDVKIVCRSVMDGINGNLIIY